MRINLNELMNAETGPRDKDLHVQISNKNKVFLQKEAARNGIVMGLYLEKLLTLIRKKRSSKE